eukprot:CAMPEP_0117449120 /NCGR_PEP_ID=MMETSP0759-20121206/7775_1 /TAXON_ID=63605 /ORGANISM="Percolomonas cosmopolitus, Strain WS" /LENGTH=721 /DNA_ID=CAMNT_0005241573 /DNA_START=351 /DNA_END=2516 /DNA_ORIENTATION=+
MQTSPKGASTSASGAPHEKRGLDQHRAEHHNGNEQQISNNIGSTPAANHHHNLRHDTSHADGDKQQQQQHTLKHDTNVSTHVQKSNHSQKLSHGDHHSQWHRRILFSRCVRPDIWEYVDECKRRNSNKGKIHSKGFSFVEGTSKTFNEELEEDAVFDNPYSIYHMERAYNITPKEFLFQHRPLSESSYYEVLRKTQNVQYAQYQLSEARKQLALGAQEKALEKLNTSLDFFPENLDARFERAKLANVLQKWKIVYDDTLFLSDRKYALDHGNIPAGLHADKIFSEKRFLNDISKEMKPMLDRSRNKLPPDERRPSINNTKKKKKNKRKRDDERSHSGAPAEDDRRFGKRARSSMDRDEYGSRRRDDDRGGRVDRGDRYRGTSEDRYRNDDRHGGDKDDYYHRRDRSRSVGSRDSRDARRGGDSRSSSRYRGEERYRRADRKYYRDDHGYGMNAGDDRDYRSGSGRDHRGSSRDIRGRSPAGGYVTSRSESAGRGRQTADRERGGPRRPDSRGSGGRFADNRIQQSNRNVQYNVDNSRGRQHGGNSSTSRNRNDRASSPRGDSHRTSIGGPRDIQNNNHSSSRNRQRSPSVGDTPKLKNRPPVQGVAPPPSSERKEHDTQNLSPSLSRKAPRIAPVQPAAAQKRSPAKAIPQKKTPTKPEPKAEDTDIQPKRRVRRRQRLQEEQQKLLEEERKREERVKSNPLFGLPSFKKSKTNAGNNGGK